MPRPPRLELPGVPLHVIQRGNNRAACFLGDADRRFYLKCLYQSAGRRGGAVHAYVLMDNHVHLLVTPGDKGAVAAMLQDIGRRYVRIFNDVHGRTGTLWEGRFKSSLVESETYLWICHRYIELNPVRAGMVTDPLDYFWSSHAHYTAGRPDRLITEHQLFSGLGASAAERREGFRSLFRDQPDDAQAALIRHAANTGSALGSNSFLERMAATVGRPVRPPRRGRPCNADQGIRSQGPHADKLL